MASLIGTTWKLLPSISPPDWFNVTFVSNGVTYNHMRGGSSGAMMVLDSTYFCTSSTDTKVWSEGGGWVKSAYQTIKITGGDDAESEEFYRWLQANSGYVYNDYIIFVDWQPSPYQARSSVFLYVPWSNKAKSTLSAMPTKAQIQSTIGLSEWMGFYLSNADGEGTFEDCYYITSAPTVPDYENFSYDKLFKNCKALTSSPTFASTESISCDEIFSGCTALTTASLPSGANSAIRAFENCSSLQTVGALSNDIVSLSGAFSGCSSLPTVGNIPTSCTNLNNCFYNCTSLTTVGAIPSIVTTMNTCCKNCQSLTSFPTIPNAVTNLHEAFANCVSLTTILNIPTSVTDMISCFDGCEHLASVPDFTGCTALTDMSKCFYNCTALIAMPNLSNCTALTNMYQAFYNCDALVNVNAIPSAVTQLSYAFGNCINLINAPNLTSATAVTNMTGTFFGCGKLMNVANNLSHMTNLTNLSSCFAYCASLQTVPTIPSSVTNVSSCFQGCGVTGSITVNSNNITTYANFINNILTTQPLKLTGSASTTLLNNLAGTGGTQIYINTDSSLNYTNPTIPTFTLIRCNQDGTYNERGLYAKASFTFSYFKSGTPHDISGRFINNISPITAIINGISNSIAIVYDENNQQYNLSDITDFTKTYHFIIANTNQTSIVMRLQTADTYNASNVKQATLDIANVINTYLKYKDENNTINIFHPTTPANNVTLLNSGFTYANVEDIIWNELFRKE